MSVALFDAFAQRAMATLAACRQRAEALVSEHREQILDFAARLYAARRLTDADLEEAFVAVGVSRPRAEAQWQATPQCPGRPATLDVL